MSVTLAVHGPRFSQAIQAMAGAPCPHLQNSAPASALAPPASHPSPLTLTLGVIAGMKLYSSLCMSWKLAAKWWFSMGERSLYRMASESLTRTR